MNARLLALVLIILCIFTGCANKNTYRFIAYFESENNGALPDKFPDGAPDDRIRLYDGDGGFDDECCPQRDDCCNVKVTNVSPLSDTQSVDILESTTMHCDSEPLSKGYHVLVQRWLGRVHDDVRQSIKIFLWGPLFYGADVTFKDGWVHMNHRENGEDQRVLIGGYVPGEVHVFTATINPTSGEYTVIIESGGGKILKGTAALSMAPRNLQTNIEIEVRVRYGRYTMDSILMYERVNRFVLAP